MGADGLNDDVLTLHVLQGRQDIGSLIQQQFTTSRDWSFGSAVSMILMAVVLGALVWNARRRGRAGASA